MLKVKENPTKWKDVLCSWVRKLSIVTISILPQLMYRVSANSVKFSAGFCIEIDKLIPGFTGKCKGPKSN